MNVLILETSSSAIKAMIYSREKGVLHLEQISMPESVSSGDQMNIAGIMSLLYDVGRKAASGYSISAIAVVGIWHSLLLCRDDEPATPLYTWMHTQAEELVRPYRLDEQWTGKFHQKTGCMPHAMYPVFKLRHLHEQGLDVSRYMICGAGEFVVRELTGEWAMSVNMASGTGLLNINTLDWDPEMLDFAAITRQNLPTLAKLDTFPLLPAAAAKLGVSAGIPVTIAFSDGFMNQIGAGAMQPGVMTMSVGTSCAIRLITEKPVTGENSTGLWCYYAADNWLSGAATAGGTNCVSWFQKNLGGGLSLKDLDQVITTGDLPVFLPFLFGERCPGWHSGRRGGFHELSGTHSTAQMYSALLEGVLFNLYQCYNLLASFHEIHKINLSGGILYSKPWRQMAADIFQQDLHTPISEQASLLGGAGIALQALRQIPDLAGFGEAESEIIRHQPALRDYYAEHYKRYLEVYHR